MDDRQKGRIEKYLMNSTRFLWALGPGTQKKTYKWLEDKGFKFTRAKYSLVIQQLLLNPGIEELLEKLIIPITKEKYFPETTLSELRKHWNRGECPNLDTLNGLVVNGKGEPGNHRAIHWCPFVEINTQFNYVERWGDFAGVWFEEIEPYINEKGF